MARPPSRIRDQMLPPRRPVQSRAASVLSGRYSPASSVSGAKRKDRDFDPDSSIASIASRNESATNISVYVRCRGRNEREVRENSGVVVNTDGVKGKTVELTMGSNGSSKKIYHFDRVFSPAADQNMIFDEILKPILEDVMSGLNCTVFAYGQTGTGKTYTMCGDVTDGLILPDGAGIIPRVLNSLFVKLNALPTSSPGGNPPEHTVKASFIELYNEELRDLLSTEDHPKLKILDGDGKKGHSATVHGMEEKWISNFSDGIKQLRQGGYKRQVAATKCNDLSSRSHTVFTITVHMKKTSESGEEYLSIGKLNLVDLAGSENIKSSGAENKRAVEAGLINKSLLTLGRVINALVDRSPHIPYRESKLTRLLQDSLGGRTKTCIIATLSPAKSNIDETLSTLNYAFRAKDIRNIPQINPMTSKLKHMRELTAEIERLKSDLAVTRQKNGIVLTQENYDDIKNESESRRIQVKEQQEKIEIIECNLKNKTAELHNFAEVINVLKDDNEVTKSGLDNAKTLLAETDLLLQTTKSELQEEVYVREQHGKTEESLINTGRSFIATLDNTTNDISKLHSKLRRRSDLHNSNQTKWYSAQNEVTEVTKLVEHRLEDFEKLHNSLLQDFQSRVDGYFNDEKSSHEKSLKKLDEELETIENSYDNVIQQTFESKVELNLVLEEIKVLRDDVKNKVGEGLKDLGKAAENISAGIMKELEAFQAQLHESYAGIGKDFKSLFDDLMGEIISQRDQLTLLQKQMMNANSKLTNNTNELVTEFDHLVEQEQAAQEQENREFMSQIQLLLTNRAQQQEQRLQKLSKLPSQIKGATNAHASAASTFVQGGEILLERSAAFSDQIIESRDAIKTRIQTDFAISNSHSENVRNITNSVHSETTRITQEQIKHLDNELLALDDIVTRIQNQNNTAHESRLKSLDDLSSTVKSSHSSTRETISSTLQRAIQAQGDVITTAKTLQQSLAPAIFASKTRAELETLRIHIEAADMKPYTPSGTTPRAAKEYPFQRSLPQTKTRSILVEQMRDPNSLFADGSTEIFVEPAAANDDLNNMDDADAASRAREASDLLFPLDTSSARSTTASYSFSSSASNKPAIFADLPLARPSSTSSTSSANTSANTTLLPTLRELDLNVLSDTALSKRLQPGTHTTASGAAAATTTSVVPLKRVHTTGSRRVKKARVTVAGEREREAENYTMPSLSASVGVGGGRRLRNRNVGLGL